MRVLPYETYLDKVHACWIGKCIGGTIGTQVEGNMAVMNFTYENAFPKEIPWNDDLDLQIMWLETLKEKGIHLTSEHLAQAWKERCWYWFNEYGIFLRNFYRGISPPVSGAFNNEYFRESMGSPIRSEIWAAICPGNPTLAAEYACKDASLDHTTNSVWGEQFFAALEAEAFFESDFDRLLKVGLSVIPKDCELAECLNKVRRWHSAGLPWPKTREKILQHYASQDVTRAVQNLGFTLLSLLYGEHDFERTELLALNCGYDTDCTCATVGSILGIIHGTAGIPERWKAPIGKNLVIAIDVKLEDDSIEALARETCRAGVAMAGHLNRDVVIRGIPPGLPPLPASAPPARPNLEVDYRGKPSIAPRGRKAIAIRVRNDTAEELRDSLYLETPPPLQVESPQAELRIGPGEAQEVEFTISVDPEAATLPDANLLTARLGSNGIERRFGLCGARQWRFYGAFFDLANEEKGCFFPYPWDGRGEGMEALQLARVPLRKTASLDRPYLPEPLKDLGEPTHLIDAPEDVIPIDEVVKVRAAYCGYLVWDFLSPEERPVRLVGGHTDAVRIWLNDEIVLESKEMSPFVFGNLWREGLRLREGRNRLAIKFLKQTNSLKLSIALSCWEMNKIGPAYYTDLETLLWREG